MRRTRVVLALVLSLVPLMAAPAPGIGQIGALRKKAEEAKKKLEDAAKKTDSAKAKPDSAKPASTPAKAVAAAPAPAGAKVWENYDFVPGNKVLFYTDFSDDRVGNFARGLKYVTGPMEIVERDDVKMLRATGVGELLVPLGRQLPQKFTLEVDVLTAANGPMGDRLRVEGGKSHVQGDAQSVEISWGPQHNTLHGGGQNRSASQLHLTDDEAAKYVDRPAHIRILMDSGYFKMYANEKRLYNIPELQFRRDSVIRLALVGDAGANDALFITSIRVAESETDVLYDALLKKGRWVTQGILFATGKAELQPESRPVLKEIASTMKKYADLKILIEGHTDNVGAAASNLTLSDARAAAVKATLVSDFDLDASRITTKGFGDTKPSAPNTTAVGRAQNRRVEIVKQ
ncbi:MAG TPA: OmpA family protein [Gemmatimonadaceae bacterium]|nr:OmpA family protein [Gemmatimonadaceae bacterium]